jgi:hypothetical protein
MAIPFVWGSALLGCFGFLSKVGAAQLSSMQLRLVFSAGILATTLPAWPGAGITAGSDKLGFLYGVLTGLLSVIANLAVFAALQNGAASIIQPAIGGRVYQIDGRRRSSHSNQLGACSTSPIGRILLQNLSRLENLPRETRRVFRATKWTDLSRDEYYGLIHLIQDSVLDVDPFWRLEKYWTVTQDVDD